jgi:hypothetical protein
VVSFLDCPQTEVAATGLGARGLEQDVVGGTQYVAIAFERAGAEVWACGRGMTGRRSASKGQRYVQKELLPLETG